MKIKRFVDKDMRRVLKRVREEQGADAVILSNRRVEGGIEVIAAVDYDEALMQHALGREPRDDLPPPAAADAGLAGDADGRDDVGPDEAAVLDALESRRAQEALEAGRALAAAEPWPVAPAAAAGLDTELDLDLTPIAIADPSLVSMRAEIAGLRGLLETQVSGLLWADGSRRSPALSQVLRNLARLGIAPDVARAVVGRLGPADSLKHTWQQPLAALGELVPVSSSTLLSDGGVVALVGPTGVGKTTTIAKLAARYAMQNGTDDIALVCADAYRIGAREHLTAFASILGVKVYAASDPADLGRILERLSTRKLVLIDTEGVSQRDADLTARLAGWRGHGSALSFYLTLSACSQEAALDETIRRFGEVPLAGAIVTKIDEAGQLGCALSALIRQKLPLAWVTDGQRIPDDLHAADRRKLWLLKRACDCLAASQPQVDEQTMATNYGTLSAMHA